MYAILTPFSRVASLHSTRANMESAYGRLMSNSLYWPHDPRDDYVLCVIHTVRHVGDFVDLTEYTQVSSRPFRDPQEPLPGILRSQAI